MSETNEMNRLLRSCISVVSLGFATATAAFGQGSFLPDDHWSIEAARRMHAAALTPPGFDPSSGTVTVGRMREVLAATAAKAESGALARTAQDHLARFDHEYTRPTGVATRYGARLTAGAVFDVREGVLGVTTFKPELQTWASPEPRPDQQEVRGVARLDAQAGRFALSAEARVSDVVTFPTATLTYDTGPVSLFAGRTTLGSRTTESGSVVSQGDVPFEGAGFFLSRPVRPPGVLRYLGDLNFEGVLALADEQPGNFDTWMLSGRMGLQPFPWFGVNATRAVMATSLGPDMAPNAGDLLRMIIGQNRRDSITTFADNQVVAVDGWFRSTDPRVPLTFYWDWGADDSAGAWWRAAGRIFGLRLAALPGIPEASVGIERIDFQGINRKNGPWYRHNQFPEGWAEEGVLLGHAIGGNGRAVMVYGTADLFDARLQLGARAYRGTRGAYNVFAPQRAGDMQGAAITASHALGGRVDVQLRGEVEKGNDWTRSMLQLKTHYRF